MLIQIKLFIIMKCDYLSKCTQKMIVEGNGTAKSGEVRVDHGSLDHIYEAYVH